MILVFGQSETMPCAPGWFGPTCRALPPFRCTACGEDCDPFEWQCRGCEDWVCSGKCMDEHLRIGRKDVLVSAAPAIINNWRELEDPLGAEDA